MPVLWAFSRQRRQGRQWKGAGTGGVACTGKRARGASLWRHAGPQLPQQPRDCGWRDEGGHRPLWCAPAPPLPPPSPRPPPYLERSAATHAHTGPCCMHLLCPPCAPRLAWARRQQRVSLLAPKPLRVAVCVGLLGRVCPRSDPLPGLPGAGTCGRGPAGPAPHQHLQLCAGKGPGSRLARLPCQRTMPTHKALPAA